MSLEHMDNFATYGIGGGALLTSGIYSTAETARIVADPDPSGAGAPVLSLSDNSNRFLRYVLNAPVTTFGWAGRWYLPNLPDGSNTPHIMTFNNNSLQRIGTIVILPTGQLAYVNGSGTTIGTSDLAHKLTAQAWHHIEAKVLFNNAAGTVEIRVDGITALTVAGVNTVGVTAGSCAIVESWGGPENTFGTTVYTKDWVMWNSLGTHNNDFFGTVLVISLIPTSDTTLGAWVPNSGLTGWPILDNAPPDDTKYIDAAFPGGVGVPCEFGMSVLPIDVTSVRALQSMVRATKTDGGDGNLQTSVVSGASTADGVDRPITGAFTYWKDIFEVDPATAAPWTVGAVNAINLKLNRTV